MLTGLLIKHYPLLLWTLLTVSIRPQPANGNAMSDALMITNLLETLMKPKTESNNPTDVIQKLENQEQIVVFPEVEKAIELKLKELKPMLQDNDHNINVKRRNNNEKEESEETIIIAHEPKNKRKANTEIALKQTKQLTDTSQKNIKYYKQLRQNITKFLDMVNTANSTKTLIIRTFDELLSLLIQQNCRKKSRNTIAVLNNVIEDSRRSVPELTNLIEMMLKKKSVFNEIEFHDRTGNITEITNEIIPQLLSSMTTIFKKYKLKCFIDRKNPVAVNEKRALRQSVTSFKKDNCENFVVCSNELTHFLKITYNFLKNTAINSYKNYTDLLKELAETNIITKNKLNLLRLKALSNFREEECNQIFIKQLKYFTLDKNKNRVVNILYLKHFVELLGEEVVKNTVAHALSSNDFYLKIKNDFAITLKSDIEAISGDITAAICDFFDMCNGEDMENLSGARRYNNPWKLRPNYKNIYVKVEPNSKDELKDSLVPFGAQNLNSVQGDKISRASKRVIDAIDRNKYSYVNVTRTTLRTAKGPTIARSGLPEYFF